MSKSTIKIYSYLRIRDGVIRRLNFLTRILLQKSCEMLHETNFSELSEVHFLMKDSYWILSVSCFSSKRIKSGILTDLLNRNFLWKLFYGNVTIIQNIETMMLQC